MEAEKKKRAKMVSNKDVEDIVRVPEHNMMILMWSICADELFAEVNFIDLKLNILLNIIMTPTIFFSMFLLTYDRRTL